MPFASAPLRAAVAARHLGPASRRLLAAATAGVLLALALGLAPGSAAAQWKWRDDKGRITVSDLPPPRGVPEGDILQRPDPAALAAAARAPAPAAASAPAAPAHQDRELEGRKREADNQAAAEKRAEDAKLAERRAENCRNARQQLAMLNSGQRMARMNDKGEREILDDHQRASEIQRAQAAIASECR